MEVAFSCVLPAMVVKANGDLLTPAPISGDLWWCNGEGLGLHIFYVWLLVIFR